VSFLRGEFIVLRFKTFLLAITLLMGAFTVFAQENKENKEDNKKDQPKPPVQRELNKGEQVAESAILVYSNLRGRPALNQIRKTTVEQGKIKVIDAEGKTSTAIYERRILRADNLEKEKIRFDQKFPNAEFALIYDGQKIFGIFNDSVFTPRDDASVAFQNQIWHGIEALLRYNENGSKVELEKEEKVMGVDYFIIKVTDKQDRSTTFYVSKKSLRVMMLEYEKEGKKYRRKFYDYNYAQGTLVPYRTVLWEDDKQIEETTISTITFGPTIEDDLFVADGG
jgi:outer membrane lipoprotein-sorting protein